MVKVDSKNAKKLKSNKQKKAQEERYRDKLKTNLLPRKKPIVIRGNKVTFIQNFLFPVCEDVIKDYIEECVIKRFEKKKK